MRAAAIYCRISKDRVGAGLAVDRQEEDCRKRAARLGWKVVDVYVDNDVSAYARVRPGWKRLLDDVHGGVIDAVICWHIDRLTRKPRELEDVIDLADRHNLALATCTGQTDLATVQGRAFARMLGTWARMETEQKQERQRRERKQSAQAGKVNGGGMRPYGYDDDRITVLEDEAAIIRECAKRILFGETLTSLARDLQDRDIRTPAGNHWQARTLRRMLGGARISGRREHKPGGSYDRTPPLVGEIVGKAQWPAIISVEESDRLRRLLTSPGRQTTDLGNPRTYMLSGLLRCGRCGAVMVGHKRAGVPRYICRKMPGTNWCGGMATNAEKTDDFIGKAIVDGFSEGPVLQERLAAHRHAVDPTLHEAVERDERKLLELAADWGEDRLSTSEWKEARRTVERRLKSSRVQLRRAIPDPLREFIGTPEEMKAEWSSFNTSQRRAVIAAAIERIDVKPADPRLRWDPSRFKITWHV